MIPTQKIARDLKTPCRRCGVPCVADYCGDCKDVDEEFCRDGRDRRQVMVQRALHNQAVMEFWASIRLVGNGGDKRDKERYAALVAKRERV